MSKVKLTDGFYSSWKEAYTPPEKLLDENVKVPFKEGVQVFPKLTGYRVPLWRLNKLNLNRRIYTTEAAQEVINKFSRVSTLVLFDHDEGKPSTNDIAAVAKNPQIVGEIMYIDLYIVDEAFELKLEKIIMLGSSLGISSVFDGDIRADKTVFDLELDRWCDLVINPSYEVFIDSSCPRVDDKGSTLKESTPKNTKIKEETKEKLVENGTTELNIQFGKMIEDAKLETCLDKREAKLNLIESYIEPSEKSKFSRIVEAISTAKGEITESRRLAEEAEKVEASLLQEKVTTSEEASKVLLEKNAKLEEALAEKEALIENMETISGNLKEVNKKQAEIIEAVEPKEEVRLLDGDKADDKDEKIKETEMEVIKPDLTTKNIADASTSADLSLLESKKAEVAALEKKLAESAEVPAKLKEGTLFGKTCTILEESTVEDKKVLKVKLTESDVVLEGVQAESVVITEMVDGEGEALEEASGDVAQNEIAVVSAALKKEKEQNKLLRSQLEKKESAPATDSKLAEEIIETGAEKAKRVLAEEVTVEATKPIIEKADDNMDHFDESVATANSSTIEVAVDNLIIDNPGLAPYKNSLLECTTYEKLNNESFKLNSYLKREALQKGTSLKEAVLFESTSSYGSDSGYTDLIDLGM